MAKILVCGSSELQEGNMRGFESNGHKLLIARIAGKVYAMNGICKHQGGRLYDGELSGKSVTCPLHGSVWDVTTGILIDFYDNLPNEEMYPVVEENGSIFLEL